ncbi:MAG: metal-dependent transcriptional regulator [Putridiphycobacter sp.]
MNLILSQSEENYLKSIFNLIDKGDDLAVKTNLIAEDLNTKAASVSEMIKKLSEKDLINYQKYKGSNLTSKGKKIAIQVIRKHRLWETFLVEKLNFNWDEVHEIAEQLEHIRSPKLTDKLSVFLGHPKFDPHGDPIPNEKGIFPIHDSIFKLKDLRLNQSAVVVKIGSDNKDLLSYLTANQIGIHTQLKCLEKVDFDESMKLSLENGQTINLSKKVIKNIYVKIIQ